MFLFNEKAKAAMEIREKTQTAMLALLIMLVTGIFIIQYKQSSEIAQLADTVTLLGAKVYAVRADVTRQDKVTAPAMTSVLDVTTAKIGDVIAGMTLRSLAPAFRRPEDADFSNDNIMASFTGSATLRVNVRIDQSFSPGTLIIVPQTADDAAMLPMLSGESSGYDRNPMVFTNADAAAKALGAAKHSEGTATVTLSNPVLVRAPGDMYSSATFISAKDVRWYK
ncbi:MAG: hypothetical protein RLZZ324_493 [Candidatus Parcubacteria bacterium]|jgi:hypothetical protein